MLAKYEILANYFKIALKNSNHRMISHSFNSKYKLGMGRYYISLLNEGKKVIEVLRIYFKSFWRISTFHWVSFQKN